MRAGEALRVETPGAGGVRVAVVSPVRVERRGFALHILLTRPERRNALTGETMEALLAAFGQARDSDARAVVLRGEDGQFSAGGDMSMLGAIPPPADPDPLFPLYRRMGHVLERLNALPQAVIAVVEGACTGGGLGMACCSDVVIACEDAKIGLPEARAGFIPAQVIPHIVRRMGEGWTRRLVATGAILDGRDALRDGLAHILAASRGEADAALAEVLAQVRRCEPPGRRGGEAPGHRGLRPPGGRNPRRRRAHHSRPPPRPRRPRRHQRLPGQTPAALGCMTAGGR